MNVRLASEIIKEEETGEIRISYGNKVITVPFYPEERNEELISNLVSIISRLVEKVEKLEREIEKLRGDFVILSEVSDEEAEVKIRKYITEKKERGERTFDDFEIMERLGIPIEQVDRILEKLEKKGVVRERKNIQN